MQNITNVAELKNAIESLEVEQAINGKLLKDHVFVIFNSFKPLNLVAGALKDITNAPMLIDNILGIVMGLSTGTLTKSLLIGSSGGSIKKIIGTILQYGITNVIASHSGFIKAIGTSLVQNIFHKRRMNKETQ
jgi:hypothetical protein